MPPTFTWRAAADGENEIFNIASQMMIWIQLMLTVKVLILLSGQWKGRHLSWKIYVSDRHKMAKLTSFSLTVKEQKVTTYLTLALQVSKFGQGEYGPGFQNAASQHK